MSSNTPNVLVIMADQLRRDALGTYGDSHVRTPNIDGLADRGVTFDAACATSPICVPFRFSFMTGRYAHSRQVPGIEWRMSPAERTLAHEANDAGLDTIYIGKWHLYGGHGRAPWTSPQQVNRTPVPRGYQGGWRTWRGFELRNDPFDTCYFVDDDPTPVPLEGYQTDALTDLTIRTLDDHAGSAPWLCVLSVEPPHPPFEVPAEDLERWREREIELPPNVPPGDAEWLERILDERRRYYAAIENLDRNVGRMLAYLDDRGLREDTVVVFLSDHGELGGSHGRTEKQYPFEPSIGIPLIVSDPRAPKRHGARVAEPVHTEDLRPTLLGLAGIQDRMPHQGADAGGRDLSPLLQGGAGRWKRDGVPLQFVRELRPGLPFFEGGWRGYRTTRHKATWRLTPEGPRAWHLFDLDQDPHELVNLVGDPGHLDLHRDLYACMRDELQRTADDFDVGAEP